MTLKEIFQRNDYLTLFIDTCCKFLDRLHIIKPTLATVETLSITFFGGRFLYKSEPK